MPDDSSLPAGEAKRERPAPSAGTDQRMLAYALRETAEAVRIMHRDKSMLHAFDFGTTPDGEKFVFMLAILPEEVFNKLPASWKDSVPANASDTARTPSPEAK